MLRYACSLKHKSTHQLGCSDCNPLYLIAYKVSITQTFISCATVFSLPLFPLNTLILHFKMAARRILNDTDQNSQQISEGKIMILIL